ncbi:hypothetical protein ACFLRZ_05505, partial [Bacteroidota bacterium]
EYQGKKYIVCDPTYINANAGVTMPMHINSKAKIITLNYFGENDLKKDEVWNLAEESGGLRSATMDFIEDPVGNYYITGYFEGTARFGKNEYHSVNNSRDVFIAKYNKNNQLIWAKQAGGEKDDISYGLQFDKGGNIIVAGFFEQSVLLNDRMLTESGRGDVFIVKYDMNGNILWAQKIGIDTMHYDNDLIFSAKFTSKGTKQWTRLYMHDEHFENFGLTIDEENNIFFTGAFNQNLGLNKELISFESTASFNALQSIKTENDSLLMGKYEKTIAGLFAVINLIKMDGMVIPGKDAQAALDKFNPNFKHRAPEIYKNIGKITFVKNSRGIITLFTQNSEVVKFQQIKIHNKARINIIKYKSGNAKVEVLSGIDVGKLFVWYDLNGVILYKDSGNLLFDYGSDHSTSLVNLKNDILN